jgi:hypothetical protein
MRLFGLGLACACCLANAPVARAADSPCTPKADVDPCRMAKRATADAAFEGYKAAVASGDEARIEQALRDAAAPGPNRHRAEIAAIELFERHRCELERLGPDFVRFFNHDPEWREAALVCKAVVEREAGRSDRALLAQLLDGRGQFDPDRAGVYDLIARQPRFDAKWLAWLEANGLADPRMETYGRNRYDALSEQIIAGRIENVRVLLEHGFDPNSARVQEWDYRGKDGRPAIPGPRPALPLQRAQELLGRDRDAALAIARLLLEHGADPGKLKWYRRDPPSAREVVAPASAEATREFEALLAAKAATLDPLRAELRRLLFESDGTKENVYAVFELGNGSDRPIRMKAWEDGGDFELSNLHESRMEWRLPGATLWSYPVSIQHGWSPSEGFTLAPGESREVYYPWSASEILVGPPPGAELRLWYQDGEGRPHYSTVFRLTSHERRIDWQSRDKPRQWGPKPGEK